MAQNSALSLVLDLALARTVVVREIERRLSGHGIGLSDLALLLELYQAPDRRMQRVDLAERLAITTSGVARQLAPLERIGVVDRESDANDARKALVLLTKAGVRTVDNVLPDAEDRADQVLDRRWTSKERDTLATLLARARD
jgi:DNA-binding MarR family transcriptional regulator